MCRCECSPLSAFGKYIVALFFTEKVGSLRIDPDFVIGLPIFFPMIRADMNHVPSHGAEGWRVQLQDRFLPDLDVSNVLRGEFADDQFVFTRYDIYNRIAGFTTPPMVETYRLHAGNWCVEQSALGYL